MIALRRIYEPAAADDGVRILVERLWPRGVSKESAHLDHWAKEVAPSSTLRTWFHHDPERWDEFKRRYFRELGENGEKWKTLLMASSRGHLTLVYSSHDCEHNNAVALKEYLDSKRHGRSAHRQKAA